MGQEPWPGSPFWQNQNLCSLVPKTIPLSTVTYYTLRHSSAEDAHKSKIHFVSSLFVATCSVLSLSSPTFQHQGPQDTLLLNSEEAPGLQNTYNFTGEKTHPQRV